MATAIKNSSTNAEGNSIVVIVMGVLLLVAIASGLFFYWLPVLRGAETATRSDAVRAIVPVSEGTTLTSQLGADY